ncbi:MAG: hypothetical protein FJW31_29050 [Acidobacteria bacterium]|nr:hypothetical protein [Acidobacteriota bacterium]
MEKFDTLKAVAKRKRFQQEEALLHYHAEFQRALHTKNEFLVQLVQVASERISPEFEDAVWEAEDCLVNSFEQFVALYGDRVAQLEQRDRRLQERVREFEARMQYLERMVRALGPLMLGPGTEKIQ